MIVLLQQTPNHLRIEGRMRFRWSRFRPFLIVAVAFIAIVGIEVYAIGWMSDRVGITHDLTGSPRAVGSMIAAGSAVVLGLVWALTARERIEVRGEHFSYQRFFGPFKTADEKLNVLEMHGLRCDLLVAPPELRTRYAPPPACPSSDDPAPPDVSVGAPMAVWYKEDPFKFGFTFEPAEWSVVANALLEHDAALRERIGLDPGLGLSDKGIWTQTRTLALGTAAGTRFTGPLFNRSRDFNK